MAILGYLVEGYLTLLAYIFVIFLEYVIFSIIFKHERDPDHGDIVKLRFWDDTRFIKAKVVMINLFIVLVLIPFTLFPLKKIMEHYLAFTGYYIIPLTFLAAALGYLAATKEHLNHHWEKSDSIILASGLMLFFVSVSVIVRLGL